MTNITYLNKKKTKQFKDLEQGACFTCSSRDNKSNLYMKAQTIGECDAYTDTVLNCMYLGTGQITYIRSDTEVVEYNLDIIAKGVEQ